MRVLITGYSGFAGGHLAEEISTHTDWQVWGTVFGPSEPIDRDRSRVHEMPADLLDRSVLSSVVDEAQPDLVFHLAGQASVRDAWREPWGTFETNVRLQLDLLQELSERAPHARVVVVTSNEVYGAGPADGKAIDESAPLAPVNPYAVSKVSQDMFAELYGRARGLDVIRLRPFAHIGPGQSPVFVTANFAKQVAEIEAGLRDPVMHVGNLDAERDFTDVRDTVRAYRLAADKGKSGEVYNIGSGRAWPIRAVLDWYVDRAQTPIDIEIDPDRIRPLDVPRTVCDAGKARAELGWSPRRRIEQTLDDILSYWRDRVAAPTS